MTRKFPLMLLLASLAFGKCASQPFDTKNGPKPNIVLINVDDLGWKDLAFMGSTYYETPNIDKLATEGMIFMNAYAGAANCAPSRGCMLSGMNTPRHGIYTVSPSDRGDDRTRKLIPTENTKYLADSVYTLPEMLKNAGYVTGSFGKWHIGKNPKDQGIDVNVGGSNRGNPGKNGYFAPYNIDHIKPGPKGEYLTDRLTDEAIAFAKAHKDTTFFLYLPFYTVHSPIMGKENLIAKYRNKQGSNGQDRPDYAAMISSMDQNVGRLLDFLKSEGLEKNTLLIFTSDNGGVRAVSAQNPLRAGKGTYYEGGIRVPLIIKWPRHIKPNTVSDERVSHLDFYPTLQKIAKPDKNATLLDGEDLSPIFNGQKLASRNLYFHFPIYLQNNGKTKNNGRDILFRTRPGSVIISGDWKLHEYFEDGGLELYNLADDPGEKNNLVEKKTSKTKELHQKLIDWRQETSAPVPKRKNPAYDARYERNMIEKKEKNQ